jgi:phytoene synthase
MTVALDETYRRRAAPPGSAQFLSWLFAPAAARGPLLGIFALLAEWRALMDPRTEASVAAAKLAWWREEMARLAGSHPVHPISRFLAALRASHGPLAASIDFRPLGAAVEAAASQVAGVPVERGVDLAAHCNDLLGGPLLVAAQLVAPTPADQPALRACTSALAAATYLARAIADYRREARIGRMVFPVDELLSAGIDNADLTAAAVPLRLQDYLRSLRGRTDGYFHASLLALPAAERPAQRGLLVLAELGRRHLHAERPPQAENTRLREMYWAWRAARRAANAKAT